jgi:subtilisin family serine protease
MKNIVRNSLILLLGCLVIVEIFSTQVGAEKPKSLSEKQGSREVPGRILVQFRSDIRSDHAHQIVAALGARAAGEIGGIGVHILDLPFMASERAFVQLFASRPEVEFVELDQVRPMQQLIPNDPLYANLNAWSLDKIHGPDAWAMSTGNSGVVIAILDTGVDGLHEELTGKMVPGWNVYNQNADTRDVQGHGTMVAGTAAAKGNNGVGVASVAWACSIMPVRISDNFGYATDSSIAAGLTWAADHGARVANVSYNVAGSSTVSRAARYFQRKGGVVTVAAGNQGMVIDVGDDPYMLTVGATDSADVLYPWSNTGTGLDLVAPGSAFTIANGGGYAVATGTSNAAPIVAGAAALLFSINSNLTPDQVQVALKESTDDLGTVGFDTTYGCGRLNLERALTLALGAGGAPDITSPTVIIVSPNDGAIVSGNTNVMVNASDNVAVRKVELYVDGVLSGSSSGSPFTLRWSTRRIAAGPHLIQTKAYDAAGNTGLSLALTVYR